jgi:hypothetical protein
LTCASVSDLEEKVAGAQLVTTCKFDCKVGGAIAIYVAHNYSLGRIASVDPQLSRPASELCLAAEGKGLIAPSCGRGVDPD